LVYYYALLIYVLMSVSVIAWLLIQMRGFKKTDQILMSKVVVSEKLLKYLGLDTPDLDPSSVESQRSLGEQFFSDVFSDIQNDKALSAQQRRERSERIYKICKQLKGRVDLSLFLTDTKLKNIMVTNVVFIRVSSSFKEVPKKFDEFSIRHLLVVDQLNKLVGLITQRDLYQICPPRKLQDGTWKFDEVTLNNIILANVMVKDLFSMSPDDSIGDALVHMVRSGYGCIPIIEKNKKLVGVLTRRDILKLIATAHKASI